MQHVSPPTWGMGSTMHQQMSGLTSHDLTVEHRLTKLEGTVGHQMEALAKMDKRQSLQERGMLALLIAVAVLAHERVPWLAKAIVALVKTTPL